MTKGDACWRCLGCRLGGVSRGQEVDDRAGEEAEVQGAGAQSLLSVWASPGIHAALRSMSHLLS